VMELVSGKRFDDMIEDAGEKGLNQALVMQIGLDIAEGLKAGNEIGLTHGDIKPENILLDEKMQAKLVDFGIAQVQGQKQTEGVWGTPYYIAPEKLKGKKSDARSDIYNLGATLFHALAGRPPFDGETPVEVVKARLDHEAPNLKDIRADINKTVSDTIARMLEPEPAMRHPTYASLLSDIKRALQDIAPKGAAAAVRGESRKVLIRRRPRSGALTSGPADDNAAAPAAKIKIKTTGHTPVVPAQPQRKSRAPRIAFAVILLFMLIGGLIFLTYHLKQKRIQNIEARRLAYLFKMEIEDAEAVFTEVLATATNIVELAPQVKPFVTSTRKAARTMLGDELDGYDLTPRLPPPAPAREEDDQDAGGDAEEDDQVTADPDAAAKSDESAASAAPGTNATEVVPPPDDFLGATDPPQATPDAPATSSPDEPEIVTLLRGVLTQAAILTNSALQAKQIALDAAKLRDLAVRQADAAGVTEKKAGLEDCAAELATLKDSALEGLARASTLTDKATAIERAFQEDQAEQRRLEEEKRRAQERLELAAREKALAEGKEAELRVTVVAGNYQEAIDTVRREIEGYQTQEARSILEALADRYNYLAELRRFLIKSLNAEPYNWGWLRGGGATEDVLGADEQGVQLRGRQVPWTQVSIPQYIRFIEHYLSQANAKRGVRAGHYLATAIYCHENGGEEAALVFLRKALDLTPYLREEAERVLPGREDL